MAAEAKSSAQPKADHSQPLPPPHDLSECPLFMADAVERAVGAMARVIPQTMALRIGRAVAADATAAERADTDVLTAVIAHARASMGEWPWTEECNIRMIHAMDNTAAPALGLWHRLLVKPSPLRWANAVDRETLMCIVWACLRQGMRLNYRADGDADTPLTTAVAENTAFAHALLELPPSLDLDVGVCDVRLPPPVFARSTP